MVGKKKGLVFVIVLVFLSIINVLGENTFEKYASIGLFADCDDLEECPTAVGINELCYSLSSDGCGKESGDCDASWPTHFSDLGCWLNFIEDEDVIDDECAHAVAGPRTIIYQKAKKFNFVEGPTDISYTEGSVFAGHSALYTSNEYSLLCGYNKQDESYYWYRCDNTVENKVSRWNETEVGKEDVEYIFFCTNVNGIYRWLTSEEFIEAKDFDEDGVPPPWDCDDNDQDVFGNFTLYSETAPQPRIICGDNKPNTCGAIKDETDECDDPDNKEACESHCLSEDGACAWLPNPELGEANSCCGDDGVEELGVKGSGTSGNFLCLNQDFIGYEKVPEGENLPPGWTFEKEGEKETCGQWCWLPASDINTAFKILTIKKPGEVAYDMVSNNQEWFKCGEDINYLEEPLFGGEEEGTDFRRIANRFYCYPEGSHWSWAEFRIFQESFLK